MSKMLNNFKNKLNPSNKQVQQENFLSDDKTPENFVNQDLILAEKNNLIKECAELQEENKALTMLVGNSDIVKKTVLVGTTEQTVAQKVLFQENIPTALVLYNLIAKNKILKKALQEDFLQLQEQNNYLTTQVGLLKSKLKIVQILNDKKETVNKNQAVINRATVLAKKAYKEEREKEE